MVECNLKSQLGEGIVPLKTGCDRAMMAVEKPGLLKKLVYSCDPRDEGTAVVLFVTPAFVVRNTGFRLVQTVALSEEGAGEVFEDIFM